jgi:hypothetical protein
LTLRGRASDEETHHHVIEGDRRRIRPDGDVVFETRAGQLGFGPCYHMVEVFKNPQAPGRIDAADGARRRRSSRIHRERRLARRTFYASLADAYPTRR